MDKFDGGGIRARAAGQIPLFGGETEVSAFVSHAASDPAIYGFEFGLGQFVAQIRKGLFTCPKIVAFAGRRGFALAELLGRFRAAFAAYFVGGRAHGMVEKTNARLPEARFAQTPSREAAALDVKLQQARYDHAGRRQTSEGPEDGLERHAWLFPSDVRDARIGGN